MLPSPVTDTGPRPTVAIRLDPALLAEALSLTPNLLRTIQALLSGWVKRQRKRRMAPSTARELAVPNSGAGEGK